MTKVGKDLAKSIWAHGLFHVQCLPHVLNLAVQDALPGREYQREDVPSNDPE